MQLPRGQKIYERRTPPKWQKKNKSKRKKVKRRRTKGSRSDLKEGSRPTTDNEGEDADPKKDRD